MSMNSFNPASGYLKTGKVSYSQVNTWLKSERDYIKQYIEGEPFIGNKYTEFGTYIHKLIEAEDHSVKKIPKLKNKEKYFEKDYNGITINGFIDSEQESEIYDYKVAKKGKWSPKIVAKDNQLKFYGLWHFLEYGSLPKVSIIHIESDDRGKMCLTGNATKYTKTITEKDIEYIGEKIKLFVKWCKEYELQRRTN